MRPWFELCLIGLSCRLFCRSQAAAQLVLPGCSPKQHGETAQAAATTSSTAGYPWRQPRDPAEPWLCITPSASCGHVLAPPQQPQQQHGEPAKEVQPIFDIPFSSSNNSSTASKSLHRKCSPPQQPQQQHSKQEFAKEMQPVFEIPLRY